jgi:hypothetical protein
MGRPHTWQTSVFVTSIIALLVSFGRRRLMLVVHAVSPMSEPGVYRDPMGITLAVTIRYRGDGFHAPR